MKYAAYCFLLASICFLLISCVKSTPYISNNDNTSVGINLLELKQGNKQCALTSISVLADYWGINKDSREIENELGATPKDGYTLKQIRDWARHNGLDSYVISGTLAELRYHVEKGRPVIVVLKERLGSGNHSVVVKYVQPNGDIEVMDPWKGKHAKIRKISFLARSKDLRNPMLISAPRRKESGG